MVLSRQQLHGNWWTWRTSWSRWLCFQCVCLSFTSLGCWGKGKGSTSAHAPGASGSPRALNKITRGVPESRPCGIAYMYIYAYTYNYICINIYIIRSPSPSTQHSISITISYQSSFIAIWNTRSPSFHLLSCSFFSPSSPPLDLPFVSSAEAFRLASGRPAYNNHGHSANAHLTSSGWIFFLLFDKNKIENFL